MSTKNDSRLRRARRSRTQIRSLGMNRLSVHRTPRHIYAQIIAPAGDKVIASALHWTLIFEVVLLEYCGGRK